MLSLFPQILFLAPLSAFLIRIALACVFVYSAKGLFQKDDTFARGVAVVESLVAIGLLAGAWTQAVALVSLVIIGLHFFMPKLRAVGLGVALLSIALSLSLLVTGPGAFAFDLPL